MKKILLLPLLLCITVLAAGARPKGDLSGRHQLRVGWGDMLFETMAFHGGPAHIFPDPSAFPADFTIEEAFDFGYTGHLFAEYQYRVSRVVRVGALLDWEGVFWKTADFDRYHQQVIPATRVRNYNLVAMPTVRFDYFKREMVSLYSGLGAGLLLAFDNAGGSALSPALNLNFIGIQVGKGHWSGGMELGFMAALSSPHKIYMIGSRLVSVSLNYTW